jgi:antitoxin ParD1/3/4
MATMNVSLPDDLRAFVDDQVRAGGYGSTSEYVRALIRRARDRDRLRQLVLNGASSAPGPRADSLYFAALRQQLGPER